MRVATAPFHRVQRAARDAKRPLAPKRRCFVAPAPPTRPPRDNGGNGTAACAVQRRALMSIAAASNPAPRCQGVGNGHPLEIIPVFRRFRRSVARDIIYTALWNALFALFFALLAILFAPDEPIALVLRDTFVYAQCIGFVIYGAYLVAGRLFAAQLHDAGLWVRTAFHALIAIVG